MEQSEEAKKFLAGLDPESLKVGDGSDGLPVWIGIDAEAQKVYKVYASGLAQGFGDGRMIIINGLQFIGWRVGCGEQVCAGRHLMLSGDAGIAMYEAGPSPALEAEGRSAPDLPAQSEKQPSPESDTRSQTGPTWEV